MGHSPKMNEGNEKNQTRPSLATKAYKMVKEMGCAR